MPSTAAVGAAGEAPRRSVLGGAESGAMAKGTAAAGTDAIGSMEIAPS